MRAAAAPSGFATIFKGWNVWAVSQKDDLDFEALMVGVDDARRLRIWVEESASAAPGAAIADPLNPFALKGGQVEIIGSAEGLEPAETQAEQKPGGNLLQQGPATVRVVRFFNRGDETVTPWPASFPSTENYLLQTVYQPTASNPITGAAPPDSLAGGAAAVGDTAATVLKVVAIGAGVVLAVVLVTSLVNASKGSA